MAGSSDADKCRALTDPTFDFHTYWAWGNSAKEPCEFTYTPLTNDHSIRLLDLEDGNDSDIIRCSLKEIDLNTNPNFDALSYSWGEDLIKGSALTLLQNLFPRFTALDPKEGESRVIICDGKSLRIRANLYNAILRLRQLRRGRTFWIDAICIDQNKNDEKSSQVNMMGKIFGSAETVLVWLGESTKNSSAALRLVAALPSYSTINKIEADEGVDVVELVAEVIKSNIRTAFIKSNIQMAYRGIGGMREIATREWFQRTWIVQEIVLAKKLTFYIGATEVSWELLLKCIQWVHALMEHNPIGMNHDPLIMEKSGSLSMLDIMQTRHEFRQGVLRPLDYNLSLCRERKATNPRDKVFALLSISDNASLEATVSSNTPGPSKPLEVDYDKSVKDVYIGCTRTLSGPIDWPNVLSLVGKLDKGLQEKLPSWVPDYSVPLRPNCFSSFGHHDFKAANVVQPSCDVYVDGEILYLSAARLDTITKIGESHIEFGRNLVEKQMWHMLSLITAIGKEYKPTEEPTISAFWRTLIANNFGRAHPEPDKLESDFFIWLVEDCLRSYFDFQRGWKKLGAKAVGWSYRRVMKIDNDDLSCGEYSQSPATIIDSFATMHDSKRFPLRRSLREGFSVKPEADQNRQSGEHHEDNSTFLTFTQAFDAVYRDRRLFLTQNGYLGIGTRSLKVGDVVMLVAGGCLPFIFQPVEGDLGAWRYIGECYVHGIMHGEALKTEKLEFRSTRVK